jgi:hypothetical protein
MNSKEYVHTQSDNKYMMVQANSIQLHHNNLTVQ